MTEKNMTEKKQTKPKGKKTKTTSAKKSNQQETKQSGRQKVAATAATTVENLLGKSDQIGTIVTKGFDLAEAGISLALNIVNRMGSIAPDSFIEKITAPFTGATQQAGQAPDNNMTTAQQEENQPIPSKGQESEPFFIGNRIPIFPGQELKVSFSINNDSYTSAKKVKLHPEGFRGKRSSTEFDGKQFSVHPAKATIDPMDFEKFTLVGTLPANLQPDIYYGWIVVTSESEIKIEVRLNVSASM
jgi:hypothetical protein